MAHSVQRFHLPQQQDYAIAQERARHDDALYDEGEYSLFTLMWTAADHTHGLVQRCGACYLGRETAKHFHQPAKTKCPECFGTTFEGGYKAQVVRPALWNTNPPETSSTRRGEVERSNATVQSTSDFRLRAGDYVFRADGTRWQFSGGTQGAVIHTGFGHATHGSSAAGYNYGSIVLEEQTSVAYTIPPAEEVLRTGLHVDSFYPVDFSALETIRGPLLPGG